MRQFSGKEDAAHADNRRAKNCRCDDGLSHDRQDKSRCYQNQDECRSEILPSFGLILLAANDVGLDIDPMILLFFGHREDAICSPGNDFIDPGEFICWRQRSGMMTDLRSRYFDGPRNGLI